MRTTTLGSAGVMAAGYMVDTEHAQSCCLLHRASSQADFFSVGT